jgi:hypothetical protein
LSALKPDLWHTEMISRSSASTLAIASGILLAMSCGIVHTPCWSPWIRSPGLIRTPPTLIGIPKSTMCTLACDTETWAAQNWKPSARTSSRSRTEPSVTTPTQPSARWMFACTSPHWAPWPRGLSRSCTTITRGAGMVRT